MAPPPVATRLTTIGVGRRLLRSDGGGAGHGDDDINLQLDELGGESRKPIGPSISESPLNAQIPTLDVAVLAKALPKPLDVGSGHGWRRWVPRPTRRSMLNDPEGREFNEGWEQSPAGQEFKTQQAERLGEFKRRQCLKVVHQK